MDSLLINQKLTEAQIQTIRSLGSEENPIRFAVVGEISNEAKYSTCVLLATDSEIFTYDFGKSEESRRYAFSDVESIYCKR